MATQIKTEAQFHRVAAPGSLDTNEDIIRSYVSSCIGRMEIAAPAKVIRYDRLRHEAVVQPLVKLIGGQEGDELERSPLVVSVMRHFSGGYLIDLPLDEGDTGWIVSADDDTTLVKRTQDVSLPETRGHHRFTSGYFIADRWNQFSLAQDDVESNAAVIQNKDASRRVSISDEAVKIVATTEKVVQKIPEELAAESEERYNTGEDTVPEDAPEPEPPETEDEEEHSDSTVSVTPDRVDHNAPITTVSRALRVYRRDVEDGSADEQPTDTEKPAHRVDMVPEEVATKIVPESDLPLQDLRIRETRVVSIVGEETEGEGGVKTITPDGTATASPVQAIVGTPYGTVPTGQAVRLPVFDKTASTPKAVMAADSAKKPLVPVFKNGGDGHFPAPLLAGMEGASSKGVILFWDPNSANELTGGNGRWVSMATGPTSNGQFLWWDNTHNTWVVATAPSSGSVAYWNGSAWALATPASGTTDNGKFLKWNGSAWVLDTAALPPGTANGQLLYWNGSVWSLFTPSGNGKYLKWNSGWALDTPSGGSLPSSTQGYYLVCQGGSSWAGQEFPIPFGGTNDNGKILVWRTGEGKWKIENAPSGLPTPSNPNVDNYIHWVPQSGNVDGHWEPAVTKSQDVVVHVSYNTTTHKLEEHIKTVTVLDTSNSASSVAPSDGTAFEITEAQPHV